MDTFVLKFVIISLVSNEEHKDKENKNLKYIHGGIHESVLFD